MFKYLQKKDEYPKLHNDPMSVPASSNWMETTTREKGSGSEGPELLPGNSWVQDILKSKETVGLLDD